VTRDTTPAGTDAASGRERLLAPVRVGSDVHADPAEDCVEHELWLVTKSDGEFQIEQLLLTDCSREPAWPGEMTLKGDELTIPRGGEAVPSNWYGSVSVALDLAWPRFSRFDADYRFRMSPCPSMLMVTTDDGFSTQVTWRRTLRSGPDSVENEGGQLDVCTAERSYAQIAGIALPTAFEDGGFRTLPFDACASTLDGTGDARGIVMSGASAGPADATLHLVVSERHFLYVDVADDHFVGASGDPALDDHVEIWTSPRTDGYMLTSDDVLPKAGVFRVRVADGRVFGVDNAAAPLSVERAVRPGHVVLRIGLPKSSEENGWGGGLSVAYVDVEPHEPRTVVATSRIEPGNASSLGEAAPVKRGMSCRIEGGALVRVLPQKRREQALLGLEDF